MLRLQVTPQNYDLMRRLDANSDGQITRAEVVDQTRRGGNATRVRSEGQDLSPVDRAALQAVLGGPPVQLVFGDVPIIGRRPADAGDGGTSWTDVHQGLTEGQASRAAPLGTVGQERPTNLSNSDCGPAAALYLHDRRALTATGQAPVRTQAQADATIHQAGTFQGRSGGTSGEDMARVQQGWFANAGGQHSTFASHPVTDRAAILPTLRQGLAADPGGGVMCAIVSTPNGSDTTGTSHWIAVTALDEAAGVVRYYEPAGPDGGAHEHTMTVAEFTDTFQFSEIMHGASERRPGEMVWGTAHPEAQGVGTTRTGSQVGTETDPILNDTLVVESPAGVFGSRGDAERHAASLVSGSGSAAVIREGASFAVYRVTDIGEDGPTFTGVPAAVQSLHWHDSRGAASQSFPPGH